MTDKKNIEVEVTAEDVEEMRSSGVSEDEIPKVGEIKTYRPARHIIQTKTPVLLDTKIVRHFQEKSADSYQTEINKELEDIIEKEKSELEKAKLREELLNDEEFLRQLKQKLAA